MPANLYRVVLPVSDIEKAAEFYSHLLGMPGKRVSTGRHYFDCGGTLLACFDPMADGDGYEAKPNPEHVYFSVTDLEGIYEKSKNYGCIEPKGKIKTRPWGERSFYARDPFGNPICFVDENTVFKG
ncbi:MAG TPA: VOC family protein [Bacillales bacterium]|nr:VOC family protein [Bacillales bacterium]